MRRTRTAVLLTLVVALVASFLALLAAPSTAADPPTVTGIAPRSGLPAGGQSITLRGRNLTGATSVLFGSVRTTNVQVVSATQLTVRTPAHGAGRVYVRVTTPAGTSPQAAAATYIYLARPATLANAGTARTHADLDFADVECASATWCGASGMFFLPGESVGHAAGAIFNGSRWLTQKAFDTDGFVVAGVDVACAVTPSKLCVFSTYSGDVWWTANGTSWRKTDLGGDDTLHLTCATSRFCMAANGQNVWRWNGTTWSAPQQVLGTGGRVDARFADLSCPTTTFCYGITTATPATALRWQKGAWEPTRAVLPSGTFRSITCSSSSYCQAGGDFGPGTGYLVYTGLAWSPPQPGTPFRNVQRPALECLSPVSCVRMTSTGAQTYNGSARDTLPTSSDAISCWATYSCLVVQSTGSYVTKKGDVLAGHFPAGK